MVSLFDTTKNFSLYTIPVAYVLALAPHAYAVNASKTYDLRSPRTYSKLLEHDQTIDKATKDKIIRCESASANGFENLAFFASAVVAGNLAGIPTRALNFLSGGYVLSRLVYNFIYINNTTEHVAMMRTLVYFTGVAHIFALFIKSGNILRNSAANLI